MQNTKLICNIVGLSHVTSPRIHHHMQGYFLRLIAVHLTDKLHIYF